MIAGGFAPVGNIVSIRFTGCDNPRHPCKEPLSRAGSGATDRDTFAGGLSKSRLVGTQAGRTDRGLRRKLTSSRFVVQTDSPRFSERPRQVAADVAKCPVCGRPLYVRPWKCPWCGWGKGSSAAADCRPGGNWRVANQRPPVGISGSERAGLPA